MATTQAATAATAVVSSLTEDLSKNVFESLSNLCKNYKTNSERLAENLTTIKRDFIFSHATPNVRLIELGATTVLITILSRRMGANVLTCLRNSVLGYYGVGFVLVPEIYEPVLKKY